MGGKCRKVEKKNQEKSNGKKQKVRLIERGETEQEEEERWEQCRFIGEQVSEGKRQAGGKKCS